MKSADPRQPAQTAETRSWWLVQRLCRWSFCTWPLGVAACWYWSPWAALAHFLGTHSLAIYSALRSNSQLFGCVVQRFDTAEQEVWLTIDDGPFAGDTAAMLEVLARYQARATFFLEGRITRQCPELARQIQQAGHDLGNHSHTHRVGSFWATTPKGARRELRLCNAALRESTGADAIGFRPPVGMANGFVHQAARQLGLPVIGWSARGYDGLDHCPERVARRMGERLFPGAILLLHQRSGATPGMPRNAETLDRVLAEIARRGYRCIIPRAAQFRSERVHAPWSTARTFPDRATTPLVERPGPRATVRTS